MSVHRALAPARGVHRALAPAKVNLGLFVGPVREQDGRHELATVMQSISLADELTLQPAPPGSAADVLDCPGVDGPAEENLAWRALQAFRLRTRWQAPPLLLTVVKRIPVAAGLGGGSADAAAALRLARHASGLGDEQLLLELAGELGADVPAQVSPGRWLAAAAGELLTPLPDPRTPFGLLVLPAAEGLSTAAVYAEADRLGLARTRAQVRERLDALRSAFARGEPLPAADLLHNDLQRAAVSLRPDIARALREASAAGAHAQLVSGSGPTVIGLCSSSRDASGGPERGGAPPGQERGGDPERAQRAAAELGGRVPAALWATPVDSRFAQPVTLAGSR
jgi:4-diphosphocytidyl-2-C-methyl-D-erythritol kinase